MTDENVTRVLSELEQGEPFAADRLLALVYDELRKLAQQKMAHEAAEHTLQPTALVHEAYLRLVGSSGTQWQNRAHFFGAAAEAMRRILIEAARRKASLKRAGNRARVELTEEELSAQRSPTDPDSLLALNEALERLKTEDPDSYRLVMLRYFGGLTISEAAETMGVSVRTANRNWSFARAWLQREIDQA